MKDNHTVVFLIQFLPGETVGALLTDGTVERMCTNQIVRIQIRGEQYSIHETILTLRGMCQEQIILIKFVQRP